MTGRRTLSCHTSMRHSASFASDASAVDEAEDEAEVDAGTGMDNDAEVVVGDTDSGVDEEAYSRMII